MKLTNKGLLPLALWLSTILAPLLVLASGPWRSPHSHRSLAKRKQDEADLQVLASRQGGSGSKWTWYDSDRGLGACGKWTPASEFAVAMNRPQFGPGYPGQHCFKTITMTMNGKTTTAKVVDECPECPPGGLDLSRSLFRFFASEDVGVLYGNWFVNNYPGQGQPPTVSMGVHPGRPTHFPPNGFAKNSTAITTKKVVSNSGKVQYCRKPSNIKRANEVFTRMGSMVARSASIASDSEGGEDEGDDGDDEDSEDQ